MADPLKPLPGVDDFQTAAPVSPIIVPLAFKENSPILDDIEIVEDVD
jgi:hypothetical protein